MLDETATRETCGLPRCDEPAQGRHPIGRSTTVYRWLCARHVAVNEGLQRTLPYCRCWANDARYARDEMECDCEPSM
jgi:hypothetical protein